MKSEEKDSTFITILERAFRIIDFIYSSEDAVGVSVIAKGTSIPKANVFRILKTLEQLGTVEQMENNYRIGKRMIKYGDAAKRETSLIGISIPYMKALAQTMKETVNLGILYRDEVLILHTEEGEDSSLLLRLLPVSPLYCSSLGKIFLSEMEEKELEAYFRAEHRKERTVNTICTFEGFQKEKAGIKASGISYDREEYEYGLTCMAIPVHDAAGKVVAAVSVSGPTSRMQHKGIEKIEKELLEQGEKFSAYLSECNLSFDAHTLQVE